MKEKNVISMKAKTQILNAFRKLKLFKIYDEKQKQTFQISRKVLHCNPFQKQTQPMFSNLLNVVSSRE